MWPWLCICGPGYVYVALVMYIWPGLCICVCTGVGQGRYSRDLTSPQPRQVIGLLSLIITFFLHEVVKLFSKQTHPFCPMYSSMSDCRGQGGHMTPECPRLSR